LADVGIDKSKLSEFTLSCSSSNPPSETAAAVEQHKRDGATHVFVAAAGLSVGNYLRTASAQLYHPTYSASDAYLITTNSIAQNYDGSEWDRVRAVTSGTDGMFGAHMPPTEGMKTCSVMLEQHGLPGINDPTSAEVAALCDGLRLFVAAAARVAGEFSRPSWAAALPGVGTMQFASTPVGVYDRPGKVTGGDLVGVIEWHRECKCWVQITPFETGHE
jgi:hypothetical protein